MTIYSDVPQVSSLYEEQAKIQDGIAKLDAGGTVSQFTVVAAPVPAGTLQPPPVSLTTVAPSAGLLSTVRAAMVSRSNAITTELISLGVTGTPTVTG